MALVSERGGKVNCRFGGNTQDYAVVVPSLPDNKAIEKDKTDSSNPVCIHVLEKCVMNCLTITTVDGYPDLVSYPRNDISAQQRVNSCECAMVSRFVLPLPRIVGYRQSLY